MFGFSIIHESRAGFWGICGHMWIVRLDDPFLAEVQR
jgi:hypothetical protein